MTKSKSQKARARAAKAQKMLPKSSRPSKKAKPARKVGKNLKNKAGSTGKLKLSSSNRGSTTRRSQVVEEDEYIAEVAGSVAFATTSYPVNLGQQGTFPWAYKIASLYEKYDFEYLEFYYRREVSEYATNGQAGKVMLSFDYDASDAAPSSKQQVEDTVPHIDGMPCTETLRLHIDCSQARKGDAKYVRPGTQPANTDIKTYDIGNLYVSTYGNTNTTTIGELRVRYKCKLMVPVLESAGAAPSSLNTLTVSSPPNGELTTNGGSFVLFQSTNTPVILTNGITATLASTGIFTVPAGKYLMSITVQGSSTAGPANTPVLVCTSGTNSNNTVTASVNGVHSVTAAAISTYTNTFSSITNFIWDTVQYGPTFSFNSTASFTTSIYWFAFLSLTYIGAAGLVAISVPRPIADDEINLFKHDLKMMFNSFLQARNVDLTLQDVLGDTLDESDSDAATSRSVKFGRSKTRRIGDSKRPVSPTQAPVTAQREEEKSSSSGWFRAK